MGYFLEFLNIFSQEFFILKTIEIFFLNKKHFADMNNDLFEN